MPQILEKEKGHFWHDLPTNWPPNAPTKKACESNFGRNLLIYTGKTVRSWQLGAG